MVSVKSERGYVSPNPITSMSWWGQQFDELEKVPELQWPRSVAVYHRMRTDSQVASVLRAVTLPIIRTTWELDADGCHPEVVALVSDDLGLPVKGEATQRRRNRTRDRFSWADHLRLALLSQVYGHAVFEQVYRLDDHGMIRLHKLGYRPPSTIERFEVARDGGLDAVVQKGEFLDKAVRLPVSDLVVYVQDREGANWQGRSLLRAAYKPWILKDRALRVQSETVERNGLGIPTYTAGEPVGLGTPDEIQAQVDAELDEGLDIATSLRAGSESGVALRNGAKLDLKGVTGTLPDADKPIRYYDEQIARAVLAHFLNLGTETGSWALGSTFADFFSGSLNSIALMVADVVNAHIIEDLVDLNFGPDEPAPRLVYSEIGGGVTVEQIKALCDAGVIFPDRVLEEYLRDNLGLPAKDPAMKSAQAAPATAQANAMARRLVDILTTDQPKEGIHG